MILFDSILTQVSNSAETATSMEADSQEKWRMRPRFRMSESRYKRCKQPLLLFTSSLLTHPCSFLKPFINSKVYLTSVRLACFSSRGSGEGEVSRPRVLGWEELTTESRSDSQLLFASVLAEGARSCRLNSGSKAKLDKHSSDQDVDPDQLHSWERFLFVANDFSAPEIIESLASARINDLVRCLKSAGQLRCYLNVRFS
ncbi:hypothetical protein RRG08_041501 [Elysia crispata]|uniref:Uncharacterized protein n=1 Tax=Elysia crispata TaxID=231223 RepID=A0AAE0Y3J0_9GAST|nr:hypothetical protein RRG08_041501 [Elysia crispata]